MRQYKVNRETPIKELVKSIEELEELTNVKCASCDRFLMQVDIEIHHKICCICYFKELGKTY